ncbi:hypothetical protein ES705_13608 [subsurface metagenome]
MPEITPVERVQKIKEHLLEDFDFEPERVRNFFVSNIFTRVFSHLVGWTGKRARMLRCTQAGELKTAPTSTGIEYNDVKSGNAPNEYDSVIEFDSIVSRLDVFIFDNPAYIKRYLVAGSDFDEIEVPAGFYSVDAVTYGFKIKNKTADSIARYQVIGWW